jgi:hypothetical protein
MTARPAAGRGRGRDPSAPLEPWEAQVLEAVGNAIEFWGFKRNHGRVWALLYLRAEPLTAAGIQRLLDLSKGAVSMVTRELEQWAVVHRARVGGSATWQFRADTDLMAMIRKVVELREAGVVGRIKGELGAAETLARAAGAGGERLDRVVRLKRLAEMAESALVLFLTTARLDVGLAAHVLDGVPEAAAPGRRGRR